VALEEKLLLRNESFSPSICLTPVAQAISVARMRTPLHTIFAVALGLGSVAVGGLSSDAEARPSVVDAVQALADGEEEDGVRTLRAAAGLAPTSSAPRARDGGSRAGTITVRFHLEATTAIQGLHLEIGYPVAKGGFVGSADGVACFSSGSGFFIPNDRDDGTMALLQANAVALTFPFDIRCRFEQATGATLTAADLDITIKEVTEDGAVGDPSHLIATVELPPPSLCDGGAIRFTSESGVVSPGWTGIFHDSPVPAGSSFTVPITCRPGVDVCAIDGSALVDQLAGPPVPLSSAGVGVCVVNAFRAAPTGSVACEFGCSELHVPLRSLFYLTADVAQPCPTCVGDATPDDGGKGGTCRGGASPDAPCDANGVVDRFDAAGADFGRTSLDCLPAAPSVGELDVDLDPLTSATAFLTAEEDCREPSAPAGSCHCAGQLAPNQCLDGACSPGGVCEAGPIDGRCSDQPFRFCVPGSGTADCDDVVLGAGTCVDELRRCLPSTITLPGSCAFSGNPAVLTSAFCVPPTRAAAINTVMGLPGPASLALAVSLSPVTVPRSGPCSATPATGCRSVAPNHESILLLKDHPHGDDEIAWRVRGGDATSSEDFGRPDVDTDVDVCVYSRAESPGNLVFAARAATGPLWHATSSGGFVYRDATGSGDGLTRIDLTPGPAGKTSLTVKGRGPSLPLPGLPIATPPLVQLQASNGNCWEAGFATADVRKNDGKRVRAVTRR
jgi:hypothetical protein